MAPTESHAADFDGGQAGAQRDAILDAALEVIAFTGYSASTVPRIASAVGLDESDLLRFFGTRENLFIEIIRRRDNLDAGQFSAELSPTIADMGAALSRVVEQNARMPGIVQLFTSVTGEATAEEHPAHSLIAGRYSAITSILARALDDLAEDGAARKDAPSDMLAVLMCAVLDGLQTQWQYNRNLDMGAHIRLFWTLVDQAFGAAPDGSAAAGPTA